jgi:hypothetical protein
MRVFLQLNLISAAFGFLFFITGFGLIYRHIWRDDFGLPNEVPYFIAILLWGLFLVMFFEVAKKRLIGSFCHLFSVVLWFPYLFLWSLVISSVIPDGVLQDTDDFGAGLLLLFVSVFVYPVYTGKIVLIAIMRARGIESDV